MSLMLCRLGFKPCNFHFSSRCFFHRVMDKNYFLLLTAQRNPNLQKCFLSHFNISAQLQMSDSIFSLLCQDDDEGLHPAYIALIVVLGVLVLAAVVFVLVWKFKIRPKSKTHGMLLTENSTSKLYYDTCQCGVKGWLNTWAKAPKVKLLRRAFMCKLYCGCVFDLQAYLKVSMYWYLIQEMNKHQISQEQVCSGYNCKWVTYSFEYILVSFVHTELIFLTGTLYTMYGLVGDKVAHVVLLATAFWINH